MQSNTDPKNETLEPNSETPPLIPAESQNETQEKPKNDSEEPAEEASPKQPETEDNSPAEQEVVNNGEEENIIDKEDVLEDEEEAEIGGNPEEKEETQEPKEETNIDDVGENPEGVTEEVTDDKNISNESESDNVEEVNDNSNEEEKRDAIEKENSDNLGENKKNEEEKETESEQSKIEQNENQEISKEVSKNEIKEEENTKNEGQIEQKSDEETVVENKKTSEEISPVENLKEEEKEIQQETQNKENIADSENITEQNKTKENTPKQEQIPEVRKSIINASPVQKQQSAKENEELSKSSEIDNLKETSVRKRSRPQLDPILTPNGASDKPNANFKLEKKQNRKLKKNPQKKRTRPKKKIQIKSNRKPANPQKRIDSTLNTETNPTERSQVFGTLKAKYPPENKQLQKENQGKPSNRPNRSQRGGRKMRVAHRKTSHFDTTGLQNMKMKEYNSLLDGNLKKFFCSPEKVRHLSKVGLITRDGILVQNPEIYLRNKQRIKRYRSRPLLGKVDSPQHQIPPSKQNGQKNCSKAVASQRNKENQLPRIKSKHSVALLGVSNKMVQSTLSEKDVKTAMKAKSLKAKKRLRKGLSPLGQMWFRVKQNQRKKTKFNVKGKAKPSHKKNQKAGISKKQYLTFLKKVQDVYSFNV